MSMDTPSPDTSNTTNALHNLNHGTVSIPVILLYEYVITFDDEITFLRGSRWSIVKIPYLVCRYLMFPFVITYSLSEFRSTMSGPLTRAALDYLQEGLTLEECKFDSQFKSFAGGTIIICAELMFLGRTYALWYRSKAALIIILVNFTAFFIPVLVVRVLFNSAVATIPISGIPSCSDTAQGHAIVWTYILLVIGETEILLSTLYQAVQYYRDVEGKSRLLGILVQHNTFYFFYSLASSVIVIATIYFLPGPYYDLLGDLQVVVHGILVTRMHRSLWSSDRKNKNLSNPNDVSLPTIHFRSLPQAE
ncbi:hypothetical protein PAXRUDRAFT_291150 [Paxillus rubicundulus Ve08.2h10]|uniref:DUF6533 domain-containing protein n=1 Tax=Paxillus rubicundulus Ve08.2h10 TaxID=930991 RepID=A0A0D0DLF2_9AGAM|nr:hypothetical protein PAXRUDRAFT_291150 [Paxillus rubicundulus Ve08.2h10]